MSFKYEIISSRKNRRVTEASSLSEKKFREEKGLFAVEGFKLFEELMLTGFAPTQVFFTQKAMALYGDLLENASKLGAEMLCVSDEVLDKLSDEKAPQGIFACAAIPSQRSFVCDEKTKHGYLILNSVRDPGNVGTIIRTAVSLGVKDIILTDGCADVWSKKCLRASMGAIFRAGIVYADSCTSCISTLVEKKHRVLAAALTDNAMRVGEFAFDESDCIVIGNEGHGLSQEIISACTSAVIIPMHSGMESLNAAAAATILIWEKSKAIK